MPADRSSESPLLDFRGIMPTPERVLEIVDASLSLPAGRLVIDWGGRFPWRTDPRANRADVMPEDLVAAVGERCSADGRELAFLLRHALPEFYSSRPAYRRLERARRDPDSQWDGALRKAASDLLDDLLELVPAATVCAVAGSGDAEVVRDAALKSGVAYFDYAHRLGADEDDASLLGGIEERLVRSSHPAAGRYEFARLHDELREWRRDGWLHVARAHECLTEASTDASLQGRRLLETNRALASHLKGFGSLRAAFEAAYGGGVRGGANRTT
ncbi:MAG: hypothetical protein ACOC2N_04675, partial [Spirochaetota bacterium]